MWLGISHTEFLLHVQFSDWIISSTVISPSCSTSILFSWLDVISSFTFGESSLIDEIFLLNYFFKRRSPSCSTSTLFSWISDRALPLCNNSSAVQQLVALLLVIWQYLIVLFLKVCRCTGFEWLSSDRLGSGSVIQHQLLLAASVLGLYDLAKI
jgi:hypothetical protein